MEVDAAEAVCVAEDGDSSVVFDVADQFVGAARDYEVNVLVQIEESGDNVAGCEELDSGVWNFGFCESVGDGCGDCFE